MLNTLKALRTKNRMTQEELAARIGIKQEEISYYEKGVHVPSEERLAALGEVFKVSPPEHLLLPYEEFILLGKKG